MAFTTSKLIVSDKVINKTVNNLPGINDIISEERVDILDFLKNNINNWALCIQAIETRSIEKIVKYKKDIIAANGWKVIETLGQGKDGITILGYKYDDPAKNIKTVKILSTYAQSYLNHTIIFSEIYKQLDKKSKNFFKLHIEDDYTYYNNSTRLTEVKADDFKSTLGYLCYMNSWIIKHTGFAFWDFGFGSGRNYMIGNNNEVKWIDYGGAGLVRCPNFESVYNQYENLPEVELNQTFNDKKSLIYADSKFLMCEFLLHCEYWLNQDNTNADVWASMIQIRPSVTNEVYALMPNMLYTSIAKEIYNHFENDDWTDYITWKRVGKFINENT